MDLCCSAYNPSSLFLLFSLRISGSLWFWLVRAETRGSLPSVFDLGLAAVGFGQHAAAWAVHVHGAGEDVAVLERDRSLPMHLSVVELALVTGQHKPF